MIMKDTLDNEDQFKQALTHLENASTIYKNNVEALTSEEYSRVNLSLSTLYRKFGDHAESKRHLELAKDKVTDKKVLLQFYQESASVLSDEGKFNHALDSTKKALDIAK